MEQLISTTTTTLLGQPVKLNIVKITEYKGKGADVYHVCRAYYTDDTLIKYLGTSCPKKYIMYTEALAEWIFSVVQVTNTTTFEYLKTGKCTTEIIIKY
jgi:hypothetical protein